jgi:hypothetical protein
MGKSLKELSAKLCGALTKSPPGVDVRNISPAHSNNGKSKAAAFFPPVVAPYQMTKVGTRVQQEWPCA